jgi:hypothetical protein
VATNRLPPRQVETPQVLDVVAAHVPQALGQVPIGVLVELCQFLALRHEHLGVHAEVINPLLQESKRCKAQTFEAHIIKASSCKAQRSKEQVRRR